MFTKLLKHLLFGVVLSFVLVVPASAAPKVINGTVQAVAEKATFETTNQNDTFLSTTVGRVIALLLGFVGTLFFALVVYSGFLWMTASGNEDQVAKAKSIVQMATIGLIITMSAYSITAFVLSKTRETSGGVVLTR